MIEIGFHTDVFNSSYWNFEQCLFWAQENHVHYIYCGAIDGVSWIHGLGCQPHIAILLQSGYDGILSIECEGRGRR